MALLIYNLIMFREGLEGCPPGQTNAAAQQQQQCSSVNAKVTKSLFDKVSKKMDDLKKLFNDTSQQLLKNKNQITKNITNANKLQKVSDGKDIDNSAACKKYPDSC